ncbi:MAG: hypothetical protein AAF922_02770 [Pseudomonadota bacterium]
MRQDEQRRISRVGKTERVSLLSRLAGLRCPVCGGVLPLYPMLGTNPHYVEKWADEYIRASCDTPLRLNGKRRFLRFLTLHVPLFLLTVALVSDVINRFDLLSAFNTARDQVEPNMVGLILTRMAIVGPTLVALLRIETVEAL